MSKTRGGEEKKERSKEDGLDKVTLDNKVYELAPFLYKYVHVYHF